MGLALQILLLLIGVGGAIISALTMPNVFWRGLCVGGFGACGFVGLLLTILSYEAPSRPSSLEAARVQNPNPGVSESGQASRSVASAIPTSDKVELRKRDRVFVNITPAELTAFFDGKTSVQALRLADLYIDKWVKISGVVRNVYPKGGVIFREGESSLSLDFEEKLWPHVEVLKLGQKISAECQIKKIASSYILYDSCELTN